MRYITDHYSEPQPCGDEDCDEVTTGMVVHDDGAPADVENGPHADEVPTMHPLCDQCWIIWMPFQNAQPGNEDAHLEMQYEDQYLLAGGEDWF